MHRGEPRFDLLDDILLRRRRGHLLSHLRSHHHRGYDGRGVEHGRGGGVRGRACAARGLRREGVGVIFIVVAADDCHVRRFRRHLEVRGNRLARGGTRVCGSRGCDGRPHGVRELDPGRRDDGLGRG